MLKLEEAKEIGLIGKKAFKKTGWHAGVIGVIEESQFEGSICDIVINVAGFRYGISNLEDIITLD